MKTQLTIRKLLLCFLPFIYSVCAAQIQPDDTRITMVVNTAQINQTNKDRMVKFYDSNGDSSTTGNHADFLSMIEIKKSVYWFAQVADVAGNPGHTVKVTEMKMKDGIPDNKQLLKLKKYGNSGKNYVRAKVKTKYLSGDESYKVTFEVFRDGNSEKFTIDPKLRIRKVGSIDE